MCFGTVTLSTPYVAVLLFGVIGVWMYAVRALGRRFNDLSTQQETLNVPDEETTPLKPSLATQK